MKILHSVSITILVLIIFLITLYFYIQYKATEASVKGERSPTVSAGK
ncbi:hypothetical protein KBD81_04125 [Candidatus Woesebacteria bacterium]|nr:hypothetical protein [Candidatus Woesebacteria bacterium]